MKTIELLVVIASIAVLAALIIPFIPRIKRRFNYWRLKPARRTLGYEYGNGHISSRQLHQIDAAMLKDVGITCALIVAGCLFAGNVMASDYTAPETYSSDPSATVKSAVDRYNHPESDTYGRFDGSFSLSSGSPTTTSGSTSGGFGSDFTALLGDIIGGPWGIMAGYGHSLSGTGENVVFGLITYNFTSNTNGGGFNSGAIVGYDKLWGGRGSEINSFSGGWQVSYSGKPLGFIGAPFLTNMVATATAFQLIATPQGGSAVGAITGVSLSLDVYAIYNFEIQPTFIYENRNGQGAFDGNYGLAALAITHGL